MDMFPVPLGIQSYEDGLLTRQRLVNGKAVVAPPNSKSKFVVKRTPGIKAWHTIGTGLIRGMQKMGGFLYVIAGTQLYQVASDGAATARGSVPGTGRVRMANDGTNLVIATNPDVYVFGGSTITKITDPDFQGASDVAWLDGYFIYQEPDTGRFFVSEVGDPLSIEPLDFASAESAPDKTVAIMVESGQMFFFGEESLEIWAIRSGGTFPFIRLANGRMDYGTAAQFSAATCDNTLYWLADDLSVRALRGAVPTRVSTDAIERIWATYETVADAEAMSYTIDGRTTYTITFPTAMATWQLDAATGLWNELESYGLGRWRGAHYVRIFGKHLIADYASPRVGELDPETFDEFGEPVVFETAGTPLATGEQDLTHDAFYLDVETGVGLTTGQGSDPQVALQWTDDGRTWSNEYWRSLGAQGKRFERVAWHRLGKSDDRTYRVRVSDPVYVAMTGAYVDMEVGSV